MTDQTTTKTAAVPRGELKRLVNLSFHNGCQNTSCKLCFANNDILSDVLEKVTNDHKSDLLGHYHGWLRKNGIEPETEYGWWSKEAFDHENVSRFCHNWIEG